MRAIVCLLTPALLVAGCDKPSPPAGQANEAAVRSLDQAANAIPVAATTPDNGVDVIGKLDRSHKGEAAPTDRFTAPGGGATSLAAFAGKPFLLNLWATWCGPCKAEMPTLDRLASDGTIRVVAISQDPQGSAVVAPFFAQEKFRALQANLDPELNFALALNNPPMPTTILYGADGKEVWRMAGGMDWTSPTARDLVGEAH